MQGFPDPYSGLAQGLTQGVQTGGNIMQMVYQKAQAAQEADDKKLALFATYASNTSLSVLAKEMYNGIKPILNKKLGPDVKLPDEWDSTWTKSAKLLKGVMESDADPDTKVKALRQHMASGEIIESDSVKETVKGLLGESRERKWTGTQPTQGLAAPSGYDPNATDTPNTMYGLTGDIPGTPGKPGLGSQLSGLSGDNKIIARENFINKGEMPAATKESGTDTDVSRYADAVTSGDAERIKKAKAMLEFKRASPEETYNSSAARKKAEEDFGFRIKYNEQMGKDIAEIKNAAEIERQKMLGQGKISPIDQKLGAQQQFDTTLSSIVQHYLDLDTMGAIVNTKKGSVDNLMASISSSAAGQGVGRITGTQAQSIRNQIDQLKPLLIQDIRKASEMGVRGMDSEKELAFYLQAVTDTKKDIQANLAAVIVLDSVYGTGRISQSLGGSIDPSVVRKLKEEAMKIKAQKPAPTGAAATGKPKASDFWK